MRDCDHQVLWKVLLQHQWSSKLSQTLGKTTMLILQWPPSVLWRYVDTMSFSPFLYLVYLWFTRSCLNQLTAEVIQRFRRATAQAVTRYCSETPCVTINSTNHNQRLCDTNLCLIWWLLIHGCVTLIAAQVLMGRLYTLYSVIGISYITAVTDL